MNRERTPLTPEQRQARFQEQWEVIQVAEVPNTDTSSVRVQVLKHRRGERDSQLSVVKWINGRNYTGPKGAVSFDPEALEDVLFGLLMAADKLENGLGDIVLDAASKRYIDATTKDVAAAAVTPMKIQPPAPVAKQAPQKKVKR
jgi:hypothetical protein